MARAKPVDIGSRKFPTQTAAFEFFGAMLKRYRPGQRVSDDDAADLAGLLKRHTEYSAKLGSGIDHFMVVSADYNSRCFQVMHPDGTGDAFSYRHCIDQRVD